MQFYFLLDGDIFYGKYLSLRNTNNLNNQKKPAFAGFSNYLFSSTNPLIAVCI